MVANVHRIACTGKPRVAVLIGPVKLTPSTSSHARTVLREANHESAVIRRRNFLSSGSPFSLQPIFFSILTVVAVVAGHVSQNIFLAILTLPSCVSRNIQIPALPSHTLLNSAPSGFGFRLMNDKCGMPPGPAAPVQVTMDSSGVRRDPARNSLLLVSLWPSITQLTSAHGLSVSVSSHPIGPRDQHRKTRSNRSFEIYLRRLERREERGLTHMCRCMLQCADMHVKREEGNHRGKLQKILRREGKVTCHLPCLS